MGCGARKQTALEDGKGDPIQYSLATLAVLSWIRTRRCKWTWVNIAVSGVGTTLCFNDLFQCFFSMHCHTAFVSLLFYSTFFLFFSLFHPLGV